MFSSLPRPRGSLAAVSLLTVGLALTGCGSLRPPSQQPATQPPSSESSSGQPASTASPSASASASASSAPSGAAAVTCAYPVSQQPAKPADPPPTEDVEATGKVTYTLAMTEGDVTITMDRAKTPCTVNSFASLATQKYFNDTSCHRLVDSGIFVLQCGDPSGTGSGGPGYTFADELTGQETYPAGTVAMANSGPDTNGSQFFLVYEESPLPASYTVFGTLDKPSVGIVARMAAEGQDGSSEAGGGKPNNPAEIKTVTAE